MDQIKNELVEEVGVCPDAPSVPELVARPLPRTLRTSFPLVQENAEIVLLF